MFFPCELHSALHIRTYVKTVRRLCKMCACIHIYIYGERDGQSCIFTCCVPCLKFSCGIHGRWVCRKIDSIAHMMSTRHVFPCLKRFVL